MVKGGGGGRGWWERKRRGDEVRGSNGGDVTWIVREREFLGDWGE